MAKLGTFTASQVLTAAELNAGAGAWATWSPTYANLTIGNGVVIAKYGFFGRTVFVKWKLTLGTTSVMSASWPTVSLPVAPADNAEALGQGTFTDTSAAQNYISACAFSGSSIGPVYVNTAAATPTMTFVSNVLPFGWTTSDVMTMSLTYEATS